MEHLDLALRGGAIILLVLLASAMLNARIDWESRAAILAVAIAKSSFLMTTSALPLPFPPLAAANLTLLASLTPISLTWLIVAIFIDPPGTRWPWFAASATVSGALYLHFLGFEIGSFCALLSVPLYGSLLGLSLWNAKDDLVECRCRARPVFAATIAGMAMFLTGLQAVSPAVIGTPTLAIMQAAGTLSVSFAFAIWILRPDTQMWPGPTDPEQQPRPEPRDVRPDAALIARVGALMSAGIWREEGLTIGALASRLSVPEHRLRRAINQGLGHRNFSSFINHARIDAARAVLSDPAQDGTTVLEIAYSVGFASLGPFNRAFRAETGMSPTEYRHIAQNGPVEPENTAPIPANLH